MNEFDIFDKKIYIDKGTGTFASNPDALNKKKASAFNFDEYIPDFRDYNVSTVAFCINISNACNLACDYCFNGNKDNTSLELEDVFRFLEDGFSKFSHKEKYFVDLSGSGEPLLYLKKILKIKEFCNSMQDRLNREVLVQFVSNGTLLTSEVAEILQNNGILFGVSIDGNKYIHNLHRKTKDGKDTYDLILNNIKSIKFRDYIGAAVSLTKDTFSLKESLIELSEVFSTVGYRPVRQCDVALDEESVINWCKEYDEFVKFLIDETLKGNYKYIFTLLNGEDNLGKFIKRVYLDARAMVRCDAGLARFTLNKDLKIYTCPAACNKELFEVGEDCQIDLNKSREIFYSNFLPIKCDNCPFKYICGKECLLEINNHEPNPYMCKYKQHLILLAIYFYETIKERSIKSHIKVLDFCKNVYKRFELDRDLDDFLRENKYAFTEGKKIYDDMKSGNK